MVSLTFFQLNAGIFHWIDKRKIFRKFHFQNTGLNILLQCYNRLFRLFVRNYHCYKYFNQGLFFVGKGHFNYKKHCYTS